MHKCFHCKRPLVRVISKAGSRGVLAKVCYNCGKPQAPRQSMRSQKPRQK